MNLFQIITVPVVAALFIRNVLRLVRGDKPRGMALLGAAIWSAATVAILQPGLTIKLSRVVGIGRGADLVLYLFVISFLVTCFYFYNRIRKIESSMTELVRVIAIQDAVKKWPEQSPPEERESGDKTVHKAQS